MAPGGAAAGAAAALLRGGTDDDVGLPLPASCEHPTTPDKPINPIVRRTVPHNGGCRG